MMGSHIGCGDPETAGISLCMAILESGKGEPGHTNVLVLHLPTKIKSPTRCPGLGRLI